MRKGEDTLVLSTRRSNVSSVRAKAHIRMQRQLRDPLQDASALHLVLRELLPRSLQVLAGFSLPTGGTQQSD
jgi:hypothetical protein